MKHFSKLLAAFASLAFIFTACDKAEDMPYYGEGSNAVLSSSVSTVAAAPADSNNVAVVFSWTNPKHEQDSSLYKFVLEIDSTTRNFSKAVSKTVTGTFKTSLLAKELNSMLLSLGFAFNTAYDVDVRVTSSYGNNNEMLRSNIIKLRVTPYKVPPKIALPASGKLFIVGNATAGGWNNPVPVPTQEFGMTDETTFVGVFNLVGGNEYLVLPVNGSWDHKYSVADASVPANGGDFGYDLPSNFHNPAASGWYKITLDFQRGKFTVVPYVGPPIPADLFIVGDATPGGWNNPVPTPSQQFTRLNSIQYQIASLPMTSAKEYLLLPVNGDWSNKYAVASKGLAGLPAGGFFGYNYADNFPSPIVSGNYKIDVNFGMSKQLDATPADPATGYFKTTKL